MFTVRLAITALRRNKKAIPVIPEWLFLLDSAEPEK